MKIKKQVRKVSNEELLDAIKQVERHLIEKYYTSLIKEFDINDETKLGKFIFTFAAHLHAFLKYGTYHGENDQALPLFIAESHLLDVTAWILHCKEYTCDARLPFTREELVQKIMEKEEDENNGRDDPR